MNVYNGKKRLVHNGMRSLLPEERQILTTVKEYEGDALLSDIGTQTGLGFTRAKANVSSLAERGYLRMIDEKDEEGRKNTHVRFGERYESS